jgi:beta-1,3-galactosyltransferase
MVSIRCLGMLVVCALTVLAAMVITYTTRDDVAGETAVSGGGFTNLGRSARSGVGLVELESLRKEGRALRQFVDILGSGFNHMVQLGGQKYPTQVPSLFWKKKFLTIGILSSASNFKNRELIRSTWFNFDQTSWKGFFIVGLTGNFAVDFAVQQEARDHQDMVVIRVPEKYEAVRGEETSAEYVPHTLSTYSSLPYKTHALFQLAMAMPSLKGYVLKTDDDCFVDVPKILTLLQERGQKSEHQNMYLGRCYGGKPERNSTKRWYVSPESFPGQSFPTYCRGTGYFLSLDVVSAIAATVASSSLREWYFEMEDISVALNLDRSSKKAVTKPIDLSARVIAGHGVNGYLFKSCLVCHTTRESKKNLQSLMLKLWKSRGAT